jgi:hypothetical protein
MGISNIPAGMRETETGNDGSYDSDHDDTHILHEDNQPGIGAVSIGHHHHG